MSTSPSHSATRNPPNNNSTTTMGRSQQNIADDEAERVRNEEFKQIMDPQEGIPHISRSSRAFRHFKNPPQPHMCIRDHTLDGQELFINVMSWTRIVMPQRTDDPIPLYGGMRVLPGSQRSPPLVYAVMANPDILKYVGRNCPDPEEKRALVELMCDFVEAMNPGLKLAREAEVLKDRDLSGELKDIWGAVQAKREREKDVTATYAAPPYDNYIAANAAAAANKVYMEFGPETATTYSNQQQQNDNLATVETQPLTKHEVQLTVEQQQQPINNITNTSMLLSAINLNNKNINDNNILSKAAETETKGDTALPQNNVDLVDGCKVVPVATEKITNLSDDLIENGSFDTIPLKSELITVTLPSKKSKITSTALPNKLQNTPSALVTTTAVAPVTPTIVTEIAATTTPPTSTKKEKLGGFLPNGCHNIFPFIKSKSNQSKLKEHKVDKKLKTNEVSLDLTNHKTPTTNVTVSPSHDTIITNLNSDSKLIDLSNNISSNSCSIATLKQLQMHENNVDFKDDACVDAKMQKLKL